MLNSRQGHDHDMKTLFDRLTKDNFSEGWPIFWRMNLPFSLALLHAAAAVAIVLELQSKDSVRRFAAGLRFFSDRPLGFWLAVLAVVYGILWVPASALRRWAAAKANSEFWRRQLGLLSVLQRFTRGMFGLLVVGGALVFVYRDDVSTVPAATRVFAAIFFVLLVAILALFVGLYGWIVRQWKELEEHDGTRH